MRFLLCLVLAGCGLQAEGPPHDPNPVTRAYELCLDGKAYWLYVRSDGTQEPPAATGGRCRQTGHAALERPLATYDAPPQSPAPAPLD